MTPLMEDKPMDDIVIDTFAEAREVYRQKELRQGLYDAGAVVMEGVLVNLHGDEHKRRRRLENRMFRRETFDYYEQELFPAVMEQTLAAHVAAGRTDLVHFGHELMLNLAALTAGVDRPRGDAAESARLQDYVHYLIEGATLVHSTQNRLARTAVIADQLGKWRDEFLVPSIVRRQEILERMRAGDAGAASELPRDILSALLQHHEEVPLDDDTLTREIAFFLLAGAHTSATAFVRTIDNILSWAAAKGLDPRELAGDRLFLQRCVHETIRLSPSSPTGMRRALSTITLKSGRVIPEGSLVIIDLTRINRDPEVFGPTAEQFDPARSLPDTIAPFGLSFAAGMHVCIGQDLAAGVVTPPDANSEREHLFGLVTIAVQRVLAGGVRPDPDRVPSIDETTQRPYWAQYPVLLGSAARTSDATVTAASSAEPGTDSGSDVARGATLGFRAEVDQDTCISSGMCVEAAPEAFRFDEDEIAHATDATGDLALERLRAIARNCPSGAIHLRRDGVPVEAE